MKEFGFNGGQGVSVDYRVAFKRSRKASDRLVKGVGFLMKKNKIDTYDGWGTIQDQTHRQRRTQRGRHGDAQDQEPDHRDRLDGEPAARRQAVGAT